MGHAKNDVGCPYVCDSESDSVSVVEVMMSPRVHPKADFMEIFSPRRVAPYAERLGLLSAGSFDITNGCDLLTFAGRHQVLSALKTQEPGFLMTSPPCTMFSDLMRLWNQKKMKRAVYRQRMRQALALLEFNMMTCHLQMNEGRFFAFERPHRALSWKHALAS